MNTQKLTIFTAVIAAILAIGAYFFIQNNKTATVSTNVVGNINLTNQPSLGQKDAPVKVVVFEDFKCPACRTFEEQSVPKLKKDFIDNGKVEFYFINFPFLGPDSTTAALATECVYEQSVDAFWEFKTVVFRSQGHESRPWATPKRLVEIADEYVPDIDSEALRKCIDENLYGKSVTDDINIARKAGVQYTPSVYVNGKLVENLSSYSMLKAVIEDELKK